LSRKEPSKFEMDLKTAGKTYFLRGSTRGLVFGPGNPGNDDHVTVGLDDGEFSQVHRKINGREDWRVTPESFQAEVESLVANNVKQVDFANLRNPGTYIVSLNRSRILFEFPQALVSILMPLLWRLIATRKDLKTENGRMLELTVEPRKVRHLISRLNGPFSILGRLLRHVPPKVPLQVLTLISKWVRVRPQDPDRLKDDLFLLASRDDVGLLWRGESGALQFLPLEPLLDLYGRAERSLPFGELSELGNSLTGGISLIGRAW
jgi:hypothetical protein